MQDLTVCITSFQRPQYLKRAVRSCLDAGIQKVVVFAMEPDGETAELLATYGKNSSVDCYQLPHDLGCNELWLQAVYRASTERVIVLHDDDLLLPWFGGMYSSIIAPALDDGVGFASWRGHVRTDDGKIRATEYFQGPTRELPSSELAAVVAREGRLSLSPVVSVFNRSVLIHALKEADEQLDCYLHPWMLLGTEIVAYLRHCEAFPRWLYVDRVLSCYGSHEGSGTVQAEQRNETRVLAKGYDVARDYCKGRVPNSVARQPKLILSTVPLSEGEQIPVEAMDRWMNAARTVMLLENMGSLLCIAPPALMPVKLRDILDDAARYAMPEDIIAYANNDLALTLTLPELVRDCVQKCGVCVAWRRTMRFHPDQNFISVRNGLKDGGVDFVAVSPAWWKEHREKIPDMYVGRNFWDFVFRTYAERATNGACYLDDGTYHYPHPSYLDRNGLRDEAQQHNFVAAKEFFQGIGDMKTLGLLEQQAAQSFNIAYTRP